jgi:hypothetical protein
LPLNIATGTLIFDDNGVIALLHQINADRRTIRSALLQSIE